MQTITKHFPRICGLIALATGTPLAATPTAVPAFPGAEGFGRLALGGRGGDVYHVTTLADSGPDSLREGIRSATGPRTIVFEVGGTIQLTSKLVLDKSFVTIAGQAAPGDGITLRDFTFQIHNAHDVIVRYLRLRLGDENKAKGAKGGDDTFNTEDIDRVIMDHCSLSWAIDGTHDLRRGGNFTLQWCIISEALNQSIHGKDGGHAMAASYRDLSGPITLHHNLISTCRDRHPTLGSAQKPPQHIVDFRNNVIYNWSKGGTSNFCDHFINCINNTWRPGPMTDPTLLPIAMKGDLPDLAKGHMSGNVFEGREDLTRLISAQMFRLPSPPPKPTNSCSPAPVRRFGATPSTSGLRTMCGRSRAKSSIRNPKWAAGRSSHPNPRHSTPTATACPTPGKTRTASIPKLPPTAAALMPTVTPTWKTTSTHSFHESLPILFGQFP